MNLQDQKMGRVKVLTYNIKRMKELLMEIDIDNNNYHSLTRMIIVDEINSLQEKLETLMNDIMDHYQDES